MSNEIIPTPSVKEVEKYLKKWDTYYSKQEEMLDKFFSTNKTNTNCDIVLIKVAALDSLYSTNLINKYAMAENICNIKDLDSRLKSGDLGLVSEISKLNYKDDNGNEVNRICYSFASKYCSRHNPDKFPIYDSFVDKMLWYFRDKIGINKRNDLKNYDKLVDAINSFKKSFGLERYSFKEIDIYLWQCGKEHFKKGDKKR